MRSHKNNQDACDDDELWTLSDIASYLKMSKSTIYKNWPRLGVQPVIAYPGAKPRFKQSEVIKAIGRQK